MDNRDINVDLYDYKQAVYDDSKDAILYMMEESPYKEEIEDIMERDNLVEYFYDKLWLSDNVTGNASGSYTFNRFLAESYLCHNLDLREEAMEGFGVPATTQGLLDPEACDVTIRCHLLGEAVGRIVDELIDEGKLENLGSFDEDKLYTPEADRHL